VKGRGKVFRKTDGIHVCFYKLPANGVKVVCNRMELDDGGKQIGIGAYMTGATSADRLTGEYRK